MDLGKWDLRHYNKKKNQYRRRNNNTQAISGLNESERRECGWNTSFPKEYNTVTSINGYKNTLASTKFKSKKKKPPHATTNITTSSFDSIEKAFNFTQHTGSNPSLENQVMKSILIREGLIDRLRETLNDSNNDDNTIPDGANLLSLLLKTRDASLNVVNDIRQWQENDGGRYYYYNSQNYLKKMMDDMNFLSRVKNLASCIGTTPASMKHNPFMRPTTILDRRTELEENSSESNDDDDPIVRAEALVLEAYLSKDKKEQTQTQRPQSTPVIKSSSSWESDAERQLQLLSLPLESNSTIRVTDSSKIMKRLGHAPLVPLSPSKTLVDLVRNVKNNSASPYKTKKYKTKYKGHVVKSVELQKYDKIQSRVSALPKKDLSIQPLPNKTLKKKTNKRTKTLYYVVGGVRISASQVQDLSSMTVPPQVISLVAATVLILVSPGDFIPKDLTWNAIKGAMANGKSFLKTLEEFDSSEIAAFKIRALEPFLKNLKFRPNALLSVCPTAAALCGWVLATVSSLHECKEWLSDTVIDFVPFQKCNDSLSKKEEGDLMEFLMDTDSDKKKKKITTKVLASSKTLINKKTYFLSMHHSSDSYVLKAYCPETSVEAEKKISKKVLQTINSDALNLFMKKDWKDFLQCIGKSIEITSGKTITLFSAVEKKSPPPKQKEEPSEEEGENYEEDDNYEDEYEEDDSTLDTENAAVKIQCLARTSSAKQSVETKRTQRKASVKIQSVARRNEAKKRVKEIKQDAERKQVAEQEEKVKKEVKALKQAAEAKALKQKKAAEAEKAKREAAEAKLLEEKKAKKEAEKAKKKAKEEQERKEATEAKAKKKAEEKKALEAKAAAEAQKEAEKVKAIEEAEAKAKKEAEALEERKMADAEAEAAKAKKEAEEAKAKKEAAARKEAEAAKLAAEEESRKLAEQSRKQADEEARKEKALIKAEEEKKAEKEIIVAKEKKEAEATKADDDDYYSEEADDFESEDGEDKGESPVISSSSSAPRPETAATEYDDEFDDDDFDAASETEQQPKEKANDDNDEDLSYSDDDFE